LISLQKPKYLTKLSNGLILIADNKRIYKIHPFDMSVQILIDADELGLKDIGNCEVDFDENIWVNEITGCKVWRINETGTIVEILGNGIPGFQKEDASFEKVRFNWIYDLRKGNDGDIYILDSKNYVVRMIDIKNRKVKLIVGNGQAGYSGDNSDALKATLGSNHEAHFDGP
jgi:hypothetical protein